VAIGVLLALLVAALASCGGSSGPKGVKGGSEVAAEPVSHAGANPFTPAVGKDEGDVKPPSAAVSSGGPSSYAGSLPGLYGGTRNYATCNAEKLIVFLERNPSKARAWADTLAISTSSIRSYVSDLTPVTLRTDTRVTNHGFVGGRANPIQAVLQAGTAVFVNSYGEPVIKCYCGNPLTPPVRYTEPVYVGPRWVDFAPSHITIINQSTTIIKNFTLYDLRSGKTFTRRAGTSGESDGPLGGKKPRRPPTTTTPSPDTPAPSGTFHEAPTASFSPSVGKQGDNFTLSVAGFTPGAHLQVTLTRPDGVVEHYSIDVGSDARGSFSFTNTSNVVTGTYHATVANPDSGGEAQASVQVLSASGG
jgi:uncharacterized protein DUF6777